MKQSNQQQLTLHYHIGIKSTKLHSNVYNIQIVSYMADKHLILNHHQQLLYYSQKSHSIHKLNNHKHNVPLIKTTYSNKWKCIFILDNNQNINAYSFQQYIPLAQHADIKSIRHCIDFMYMDQFGAFMVLMSDCIKMVYVDIVSNHLRSLFKNAFKFKITQVSVKVLTSQYFLQYANKITRIGQYFLLSNSQNIKIIWYKNDKNINQKSIQEIQQQKTNIFTQGLLKLTLGNQTVVKISRSTIIHMRNICKSAQQITYTYYNPQQYLLICGTNLGKFIVYKINVKNIIATSSPTNKSKQISIAAKSQQAFKLHLHNNKPICNIQMYSTKIVLSMGLDQYIQVVSLDQMSSIQKFKASTNLSDINFISNSKYVAVKTIGFDQYLYQYEIALDYQLILQHNSQISHNVFNQNRCFIVLTDNSVNLLHIGQHKIQSKIDNTSNTHRTKNYINNTNTNTNDINSNSNININKLVRQKSISKKQKSIRLTQQKQKQLQSIGSLPKQSFIPPRCKSILCMQLYPYTINQTKSKTQIVQQLWILTDQSQIYRYLIRTQQNIQRTTKFQIIGILQLYSFIDSYKHETKQKVNTMKFIDIVPVYYDSDVKQKNYYPNFSAVDSIKPIGFGCQTGQLLICSSLQPNNIISRIRYFGQPVKSISSCFYPQSTYTPQQNDNQILMQSKIFENKDGYATNPHRRRLIVLSSYKQIVALMISNYQIPQTVYKLLLTQVSFFIKPLPPCFTCIISGNSPKIIFPCRKQPQKLRIWTPKIAMHDHPITCLQYCNGNNVISGDQHGKIVLWNLQQQILVSVIVSQSVLIQLCYCWNNKVLFGYNAKIFQMSIEINIIQNKSNNTKYKNKLQLQQQTINNQNWLNQLTVQLSFPSSHTDIQKLFKSSSAFKQHKNNHEISAQYKVQNKKIINQNVNLLSGRQKSIELQQTYQNKQIDTYVAKMKKSIIQMTHAFQGQSQHHNKYKTPTNKNIKSKSNTKYTPSPHVFNSFGQSPSIQLSSNSKLTRAKSILTKFKQAQLRQQIQLQNSANNSSIQLQVNKTQISLPQIKNQYSAIQIKQYTQLYREQKYQKNKNKKNRNKKYQFLFHFPNAGLYTQLISKNMME